MRMLSPAAERVDLVGGLAATARGEGGTDGATATTVEEGGASAAGAEGHSAPPAAKRPRWRHICLGCVHFGLLLLCCRAPPKRFQPRWLSWWLKTWYSSVPFWKVFPWLVTIPVLFGTSFMTLWVAQTVFGGDKVYVLAFCEALGISLCQGWFVQDVAVIAIRNNIKCTKARIRSHRYQFCEKIVLSPLILVKKLISATIVDS